MELKLSIASYGGEPLPPGSKVKVELRDTSLADAPAVLLQQANTDVPKAGRASMIPVTLYPAGVPDGATVWAHIDVDGDGRINKGDYVSVESYPVTNLPVQNIVVKVKKVT